MHIKLSLENKIIVVFGAKGGIGKDIAELLKESKSTVIPCDRGTNNGEFIDSDITNKESLEQLFSGVVQQYGRIDGIINCAGVNSRKKYQEYTQEDWGNIININLSGAFLICQTAFEFMKKQGAGSVVHVGSTQSFTSWNGRGRFSLAPYNSAKAGLVGLIKASALEVAKNNLRVNMVCPAFVDTPLVRPVKDDAELYNDIISRTPLGRFAKPREISNVIAFLISDESSFITGQSILVDGGWTIE
jgi:NAD(P)-dependent dehydrogenase (short-subunit alcohol dehydrogenase family)